MNDKEISKVFSKIKSDDPDKRLDRRWHTPPCRGGQGKTNRRTHENK